MSAILQQIPFLKGSYTMSKINLNTPIVLFAYNRPEHLKLTLTSLAKNFEAKKTRICICIDGPKTREDYGLNRKVIEVCESFGPFFEDVHLKISEENLGLAKSIVGGIGYAFSFFDSDSLIILEDDLEVSEVFLEYMNTALNRYKDNAQIYHINAFSSRTRISEQVFLTDIMLCWGWATWRDRWANFSNDYSTIDKFMDEKRIRQFSYGGQVFNWQQYLQNKEQTISTWAVFWALSIFIRGGTCLQPPDSLVHNTGNDGSGVHSSETERYSVKPAKKLPLFPVEISYCAAKSQTLVNYLFPKKTI